MRGGKSLEGLASVRVMAGMGAEEADSTCSSCCGTWTRRWTASAVLSPEPCAELVSALDLHM